MAVQVLVAVLTGGAAVAIIEGVKEALRFRRERKAKKDDQEHIDAKQWREEADKKINALVEGVRYTLYDRIRFLALEYIADGKIDFDDRRILNAMHNSYHNGLGGNGDLDTLMAEVNRLPIKKQ
ncbi:MAG: hypothetical protein ACI4HO_08655 [Ruminococcus sp.]